MKTPATARILIKINGGCPTVVASTIPIEVHVIDWDNASIGATVYDGPTNTPGITEAAFDHTLASNLQQVHDRT